MWLIILVLLILFILVHRVRKNIGYGEEFWTFIAKNEPKYNKEPNMENRYLSPPSVTGDYYKSNDGVTKYFKK